MRFEYFFFLLILFLAGFALPSPLWAQGANPVIQIIKDKPDAPRLSLPLRCTMGTDCWIMNYPDVGAAGDGVGTDSACLSRTYDGHKGTDFAINDKAMMDKDVDVLATADGTVVRVRDGEPDRFPTKAELEQTKKDKKDCGNGVLIDHGDFGGKNWQTMSCHLMGGSVSVKPGQKVKLGDTIGRVGLSGVTEFPHLHLGVTRDGAVIDPFTGSDITEDCGANNSSPLWLDTANIAYVPLFIGTGGFAKAPPTLSDLNLKNAPSKVIERDASSLVFYVALWGVRTGDVVTLEIVAPSGDVFAKDVITQSQNRTRQLYFVGREKPQDADFEKGSYNGTISVKRPGTDKTPEQIFTKKSTVTIE